VASFASGTTYVASWLTRRILIPLLAAISDVQ
jgi:hypothetical protein